MKKNIKKNNKGFSLVELIVVILIMAIIGVALAPQVMKWVGNARESADVSNYNSLYANVQLALADNATYKAVSGDTGTIVLTMSSSGVTPDGTAAAATKTAFENAMTNLDSSWRKLPKKVSGGNDYVITITCGISPKVEKTTEPEIKSNDLK